MPVWTSCGPVEHGVAMSLVSAQRKWALDGDSAPTVSGGYHAGGQRFVVVITNESELDLAERRGDLAGVVLDGPTDPTPPPSSAGQNTLSTSSRTSKVSRR